MTSFSWPLERRVLAEVLREAAVLRHDGVRVTTFSRRWCAAAAGTASLGTPSPHWMTCRGPGAVQVPERAHGHPRVREPSARRASASDPAASARRVHLEEARDRHGRRPARSPLPKICSATSRCPSRSAEAGPVLPMSAKRVPSTTIRRSSAEKRWSGFTDDLVVAEDVPGEVDAPLARSPPRSWSSRRGASCMRADRGTHAVEIEADLGAERAQPFERSRGEAHRPLDVARSRPPAPRRHPAGGAPTSRHGRHAVAQRPDSAADPMSSNLPRRPHRRPGAVGRGAVV